MTQIATVERILNNDYAEISVPRKAACGHDCEECAGCGVSGSAVHARAANPIGALPGQKVVVQSDTKKLMNAIMVVYLTPVVLFLAGYLIMLALGTGAAMRYLVATAGFVISIILAIRYDRKLRERGGINFRIVRLF